MADTINRYRGLRDCYLKGKIEDPEEFNRLLNILMIEVLLDIREVLRDIKGETT